MHPVDLSHGGPEFPQVEQRQQLINGTVPQHILRTTVLAYRNSSYFSVLLLNCPTTHPRIDRGAQLRQMFKY